MHDYDPFCFCAACCEHEARLVTRVNADRCAAGHAPSGGKLCRRCGEPLPVAHAPEPELQLMPLSGHR